MLPSTYCYKLVLDLHNSQSKRKSTMENKHRNSKFHPSLPAPKNQEEFSEFPSRDRECTAKNMLFQLSDHDSSLPPSNQPKDNEWFKIQAVRIPQPQFSSVKQLRIINKSLYVQTYDDIKTRTQTSQDRRQDFSVIPHLKSHLLKLESPEKVRHMQKKKERTMFNALKLDENYFFNDTKTTKTTPTHFYRSKNTSSYKKTKKNTMFVHNFTHKGASQAASQEKSNPLFRDFGERMEAIKQARKNRTLRNLLF